MPCHRKLLLKEIFTLFMPWWMVWNHDGDDEAIHQQFTIWIFSCIFEICCSFESSKFDAFSLSVLGPFFIISSTWAATRKRKARSAVGWILSSTIRIKLPSAWLRKILTAVDCCKQLQPVNALCILRIMLQNRPSEFLRVNNRFRHQIHNSKSFIHYYDLITSGVINMLIMLLTQLSKDVHDSIPSILGIQPPR